MKNILLLLLLAPLSVFSQKFTFVIDEGQHFSHDSTMTTTEAFQNDSIKYLKSGKTNLTFTFDFEMGIVTRQFQNLTPDTCKIVSNLSNQINLIDVMVEFSDGLRNYTIFRNGSSLLFMSRTYERDKLTGWFDPVVEIKKRP
jgi:hypothetical protein